MVPLRLLQFNLVGIAHAHGWVNFTVPQNSFRMSVLFALITPLVIYKICLLLMIPQACWVPVEISFTFRVRWSPKTLCVPPFLRAASPSLPSSWPHWCSNKTVLGIFQWKLFDGRKSFKYWHMLSNFSFCIFWNLLLIQSWSTVWFFYLLCRKTQFRIRGVFHDRAYSICDFYIFFILRSLFFLFKIVEKLFFIRFSIRLSNKNDK